MSVIPQLEPLLSSTEVDHRWWALRVLAQLEDPPLDHLWKALRDPSADVRQCAALALYYHPDERSVSLLIECLDDSDSLVPRLSANALIAIGPPAVPALIEALGWASQSARREIVRSLAAMRDYRALPVLFRALSEDSALLQFYAESGLTDLKMDMVFLKPD